MEETLLKMDTLTIEYRFARDLFKAVIEMQAVVLPSFSNLHFDNTFSTVAQRIKIRNLLSKEWPRLDDHVRKFTNRNGQVNYGDQQFLLCVVQFIEEYQPELKSDEDFMLVCSKIAYVAACFLENNDQSDAISVAVDRVYEILIDTFYPEMKNGKPLVKDAGDRKYRFAYDLVQTLVEFRGISVPDLEFSDADNCLFTINYKSKIEEFFTKESCVLHEMVKSFTNKDGILDYTDESFSQCMDEIIKDYESGEYTEEEIVLVCARIAYAATLFLKENFRSNLIDMAIDRIHKIIKTFHCKQYEKDNDYRFASDLVRAIVEAISNPLFSAKNSHSDASFFMTAHRNKIEEFLSKERPYLDKVVKRFTREELSLDYDTQFVLCVDEITNNCTREYETKEEIIHDCVRISYVAARFSRKNIKSNAPEQALDRMSKIVKYINRFSNSKEGALILHNQDDHYHFAYDLIKRVLELKSVPVSDIDLPSPENVLFTDAHGNKIEELLSRKSPELDKIVKTMTNVRGSFDYSDSNFISCINQIIEKYQFDLETEDGFVLIGAVIAYVSAYFFKNNCKSNSTFLATNRIYEMIKEKGFFKNSTVTQALIVKAQDDHYRFAYDLTRAVFEILDIPVSPIDLPKPNNLLFTYTHRIKIKNQLFKEWFDLNERVARITDVDGCFGYTDDKFLYCMDQIVQDYPDDQKSEEGFVYICARIAYAAAKFLKKNFKSNALFLAVNRMYQMSKDALSDEMDKACVKEEIYHFTKDLVKASLKMRNNFPFVIYRDLHSDSALTNVHLDKVQDLLSKEWPRLHALVRRFTGRCTGMAFSDGHFLHCMEKVVNDYESEQKSEAGLLLVSARIAYLAACFLRKNRKSNAVDLAVDHIHKMRRTLYRFRNSAEEKSLDVDGCDNLYRFTYDLVGTVMELQNTPLPDIEMPDPDSFLFTAQHRKRIKKLFRRECSKMDELVEKLTNKDGELNCSDGIFQHCMEKIFKRYKYEQRNKDGFVRLCARIAYPASYFLRNNFTSNAITLAIGRIHEMVRSTVYFNKDLEDNSFMKDLQDDKYRFAYDLVRATVEYVGIPENEAKNNFPSEEYPVPENFLFTDQHKQQMAELFSKEWCHLNDLMQKFTCRNGKNDYSDRNFMECMDHIVELYKPIHYTEEDFVLLCGRIALIAAIFFRKMCGSNAALLAVERIHEMVKDVFSKGTLNESSW